MSKHAERTSFVKTLSRGQWAKIAAAAAAVGLIATAGVISRDFYQSSTATPSTTPTSFSATDGAASRSASRGALKSTTYVTVKVNGKSRVVLGEKANMTTVKDVLETGDIVLDPEDSVTPSLDSKVSESTVISINRANTTVETTDTEIAFNEVRKETSSLPKGQEKVETEGEEGVMESTNLVTRSGDTVISSNMISSYVKKAPVDKVVLVGTGSTSTSSSSSSSSSTASVGTTVPAGEMQQWAHDYLISNGYTEADFTATVYIISHESGWSVSATNPSSGAYGLPQALPGSKMVSAGADWATNYQTQLKWFWGYCASRYGSIQGAYSYWLAHKCY